MNRRDFMRPTHVAAALGQAVALLDSDDKANDDSVIPELALIRAQRRAMATLFEIALPIGTPDALFHAESALDEIDRVEDKLTAYRETSETSRLNRKAFHDPVVVDDELFRLLALCQRLNEETGGAFDITSGPLIKAWGFFRRRHRLPGASELAEALSRVGMRHVELNAKNQSVRYSRPCVEINFGSIGKGHALDRVADLLMGKGIDAALVHGGYSSVFALGSTAGTARGWPITVRHPWAPERHLAVLHLRDRGLATSAATYQHFDFQGRRFGHIIDPRTGYPAATMLSATVVAPTAAEADALATAFFINGIEWARRYCDSHPEIGAVMLPADGEIPVTVNLPISLRQGHRP